MVKADVVRVYHCPHGVGSFPGGGQAGLHPELQVGKAGEEGSGQRGWGVIQARGGRGGGGKGPHLARLHLGQALLPRLLVLQADPHHAVYVEGVSVGRKKTCQLLFQEEEGTLERVYPLQGRQLLPSAKIIKVRSMVSIPSSGWNPLPHSL